MILWVQSNTNCLCSTTASVDCSSTDVQCRWKQPTIHHETNSRYLHWTTSVVGQTFCSTLSSLISRQRHRSHLQCTCNRNKTALQLGPTVIHWWHYARLCFVNFMLLMYVRVSSHLNYCYAESLSLWVYPQFLNSSSTLMLTYSCSSRTYPESTWPCDHLLLWKW